MSLWYPKDTGFELIAFLDSNHAGCLDSCKSTSSGIQFLGVISLSAGRQISRTVLQCLPQKLEAVATACFTQNRSIICLRHGKTPYELMHGKQPDLSFFHVFGALCYPTNDSENIVQDPHLMIPGTISSGIVQKSSSSTSYVPPSRNDWDLLFQPLFDELLNPPPSVDNQAAEVIAPIAEVIPQVDDDSTGSPSSTTVDQDIPSPSKSPTPTEKQSSAILQDVKIDNLDIEVVHMGNDQLLGGTITEVASRQSLSTASPQSIVQPNHPMTHPNSKWTKHHPLNYIIGPLSRPVSTRLQLHEQALFAITMLS
nr:retrovirus-related Pol polyprotein from transposon TNT 1-94 [Tanacetum cinerariifolium]